MASAAVLFRSSVVKINLKYVTKSVANMVERGCEDSMFLDIFRLWLMAKRQRFLGESGDILGFMVSLKHYFLHFEVHFKIICKPHSYIIILWLLNLNMAYTQYWLLGESPNSEFHWKYIVALLLTFYSITNTHMCPQQPPRVSPLPKEMVHGLECSIEFELWSTWEGVRAKKAHELLEAIAKNNSTSLSALASYP